MADKYSQNLLIGLPKTGKTTFLAALWHVVDSGVVPDSMKVTELHGNREYLNEIRGDWLSCQELSRTLIGSEEFVSMRLAESNSGTVIELTIPDLSGEVFSQQWERRQWTAQYSQIIRESTGALLFVHPEKVIEPLRIDQADALVAEIEGEDDSRATDTEWISWDASLAPTQVKLVELLQFMDHEDAVSLPFRISVIVSAWDLLASQGISPEDWIKERLPLLYQFLASNSDKFPSKIYGVSAQGGDLSKNKAELLSRNPPSERVQVIDGGAVSHDLTVPIKWLTV